MYLIVCDGGKDGAGVYGSYKFWRGECLDREMRLQKHNAVRFSEMQARQISTNNEAEYMALISALLALHKRLYSGEAEMQKVFVRSDSLLVINQLNGEWRVRSENIRPLYEEAMALLARFKGFVMQHIPRNEVVAHLGH